MRTTSVRKFTRALMMSMALATIAFSGNAISAEMTTKHKAIKECSVCHTQENAVAGNAFVVPSDKTCIGCHGDYKALAAKTQPKDPHDPNPHASHHYGANMSCTTCHAEHKESRVLCNDCHNFPFGKIR